MNEVHRVVPLGIFGVVAEQAEFEKVRGELQRLAGALVEEERAAIARYLRGGAIIFATMSYSWDVLAGIPATQLKRGQPLQPGAVGGAFVVPGGVGIQSDGTYYWRTDTADYVEHYGIGLPKDFLRHGRSLGWVSSGMSTEEVLAVDRYLVEHARRFPPVRDPDG